MTIIRRKNNKELNFKADLKIAYESIQTIIKNKDAIEEYIAFKRLDIIFKHYSLW